MTPIRLVSLYSGSTGNAFLIATPNTKILIDAGKNAKQLCLALAEAGVAPEEIRAIFITHEHNDHVSALPVFLKKHPIPVHIPSASAYKLANDGSVAPCLCLHPPLFCEELGELRVTSFPTPHDSRGSVGYRIELLEDGKPVLKIGYATDIGHVTEEIEQSLLGCDAVVLESNHDVELLRMGPYPYDLKQRILSRRGHLSNPDSAALAARLCACGTRALILAHLSQENNLPDLALSECLSAVGDDGVQICVAKPDAITEVSL